MTLEAFNAEIAALVAGASGPDAYRRVQLVLWATLAAGGEETWANFRASCALALRAQAAVRTQAAPPATVPHRKP